MSGWDAAKNVNTPWALRRYRTLEEWEQRAAAIRRHILVCAGLWPLPDETPLKAQIFGRIEREGYGVEKVFFESLPGFFVCGNLYRPLSEGPVAAIACPHGHWERGRLENTERGSIAGRCINFARQGMVAFSYDMVGYNDSDQLVHREIGGRREALWGIGALSLQLWNSIRVVDFLAALADVDAERIGCTGASGGGTQTFLLMAVDERIKVAAPVNMVSAFMQGGCRCENQGHLRLDINNVEIASCMAPRPLLLVSCSGDWTANTPEVEFPAVRAIYGLYGAQNKVREVQIDAPHNYNQPSREAVYAFFKRHLLGGRGRVAEQAFAVEQDEDLLVFSRREKPAHALDAQGVFAAVIARSEKRLAARLGRFQRQTRPALASLLGVDAAPQVAVESLGFRREAGYVAEELVLGRVGRGERVRAVLFLPRGPQGEVPATLIADVHWADGVPGALAQGLLQIGQAVLVVAPFLTAGAAREGHDEADPPVPHVQSGDDGLPGAGHPHGSGLSGPAPARGQAPPRRSGRGPAFGAYLRGRWPVASAAPRWTGVVAIWETTKRGAERFSRRGFAPWAMCGRPWRCAPRGGCWYMGEGVISHSASLGDAMVRRVWEHGSWLRRGGWVRIGLSSGLTSAEADLSTAQVEGHVQ